jgi:hypothetical protein
MLARSRSDFIVVSAVFKIAMHLKNDQTLSFYSLRIASKGTFPITVYCPPTPDRHIPIAFTRFQGMPIEQ